MAKIWDVLFASGGDKITIPEPAQAGGEVSVTQGWTPDYELPDTDPDYKPIGREEMNGVIYEVTESIQQLQLQGAAEWSASLAPYPKGAEVIHAGERWYSPGAGNSTEPGAPGHAWSIAGSVAAASETVAGIAEVATQAEVDAGTAGNMIVTPAKLRFGFSINLGSSGFIAFPSWLGGLVFQWSPVTALGAGSAILFPITFPTACFGVFIRTPFVPDSAVTVIESTTPTVSGFTGYGVSGVSAATVTSQYFTIGY